MKAFFQDISSIFQEEFESYASTLQLNPHKAKELGLDKFLVKRIVDTAKKDGKRKKRLLAQAAKKQQKKIEKKGKKLPSSPTGSEVFPASQKCDEVTSNLIVSSSTRPNEPNSTSSQSSPSTSADHDHDQKEGQSKLLEVNEQLRRENEMLKIKLARYEKEEEEVPISVFLREKEMQRNLDKLKEENKQLQVQLDHIRKQRYISTHLSRAYTTGFCVLTIVFYYHSSFKYMAQGAIQGGEKDTKGGYCSRSAQKRRWNGVCHQGDGR